MSKDVDSFYTSKEWRVMRLAILKRDSRRCVLCGVFCGGKGQSRVDHILPRKKYPQYALEPNNLRTLCVPCDNIRHGRDRAGRRDDDVPEIGVDGFPVNGW